MKAVKSILLIAGTRPNFIKLAPLYHRLKLNSLFKIKICHTGQHYDYNMSEVFWSSLKLPAPDFLLNINGGGVSEIIGKTILGINEIIKKNRCDLIIVFGDVNATAAGAIVASQNGIQLMHVESGLRSFDRTMPEENNRIITDHLSDYLMVSEESGLINLSNEGISKKKIYFVGNIMIESLLRTKGIWSKIKLSDKLLNYISSGTVLVTFHRPENVDNKHKLYKIVNILTDLSNEYKIVFPIHPRTSKNLMYYRLSEKIKKNPRIYCTEPMGYFEFLKVLSLSKMVITDSGGIQEESTFLKIPCITVRNNTERPITVKEGTNTLVKLNDCKFNKEVKQHLILVSQQRFKGIKYWDHLVSKRITQIIEKFI